jgi:hypothetical protein
MLFVRFQFSNWQRGKGFPGRRCDNLSQHAATFPNADLPPPIELSGEGGHAPVTMRGALMRVLAEVGNPATVLICSLHRREVAATG